MLEGAVWWVEKAGMSVDKLQPLELSVDNVSFRLAPLI